MTHGATEGTAEGEPSAGTAAPGWLRFIALAGAAGVLTFGSVGLLLAVNGWYRPALAFPLGALVWIAALVLARPAFASAAPAAREAHVFAALGVAAILAITAWNAAHASQHVLENRDGGSYANTARWIARDGSLEVKPRVGPFANQPGLRFDSNAVYQMPNGSLQFQFAHMLPVVLAEAYAIKGDAGLFHGPEVLSGIALLSFFVLAWRCFRRPLFALSAMLALAFVIPQVSFSRDSYSEIPSQILLFTALWLLVSPGVLPKWRVALVSGLFLGALETIRIDAVVFLIGVPVLLAVAWVRADRCDGVERVEARRSALLSIGAFVGGLVPGMALGFVDLMRHSGGYYHDLTHNLRDLEYAAIGSAIACAAVVGIWPLLRRALRRLPAPMVATAAGVLVGLAGFFAWVIRPRVQHLHSKAVGLVGGLQHLEHVAVDPTRNYFERSMSWMSWYLGPVTVAVAIVGAALLTRELLLGRRVRVVGVLAVLVPGSALYLYKASAVSDHVWVTRRFLVSAFPLLVLLALGLASACAGIRPGRRFGPAGTVGAVAFAIIAVGYPLYTVSGVQAMTEQRGFLTIVNEACADLGPHAAVVVLQHDEADLFDDKVPQTLRSFCGADVAVIHGPARAGMLRDLAGAWNAQGRSLFVVAQTGDVVQKLFPNAKVEETRQAVNAKILQLTLTHRPDAYAREALSMVVARVPIG